MDDPVETPGGAGAEGSVAVTRVFLALGGGAADAGRGVVLELFSAEVKEKLIVIGIGIDTGAGAGAGTVVRRVGTAAPLSVPDDDDEEDGDATACCWCCCC